MYKPKFKKIDLDLNTKILTIRHKGEIKEIHLDDLIELGNKMPSGSTEVDYIIEKGAGTEVKLVKYKNSKKI